MAGDNSRRSAADSLFPRALLLLLALGAITSSQHAEAAGISPAVSGQSATVLRITVRDAYGGEVASGNGFVVDARGIVAAPYSLVAQWVGASQQHRLSLMTGEGTVLDAEELVIVDEGNGLALVRVKAEGLPAVRFGVKPRLRTGEKVAAFDLSRGRPAVPFEGVVRGMEKDGLLRIFISLPPGNEGTPVFAMNGELAGAAIVTGAAQEEGSLTIAVPARPLSDAVHAWAEFERGRTLGESGRNREAMAAFSRAIQLRPEYADAHYALGVTCSQLNLHAEALDSYRNTVRLNPNHATAYLYLGKTYTILGRHDEAIDAYKAALKLAPDYVEAHVLLGYSYQEKGMNHSALKAYEEAVRIRPDFVDAHIMQGGLYAKFGNYGEALKSLKRAVEMQPQHADARFRLGMLYLLLDDRDAAMDEYRKLETLDRTMAETLLVEIRSRNRGN